MSELLNEVAWEQLLKQARDEGRADHDKTGVGRQLEALSPSVPSVGASVSITGPDGRASLGRDVVASGDVGAKRYACYAVGWYVVTAAGWTGYFIKTKVNPRVDGSFATPVLQMGSPGETGSSWQPFLLGATPAGCAWIRRLWARTPTGEYHDGWPPPGITVLYHAPAATHRSA